MVNDIDVVCYSPVPPGMMGGHISPMPVQQLQGAHVKSEPITPPHESTTPQTQPLAPPPPPIQTSGLHPIGDAVGGGGHLSPAPGHLSPHIDTAQSPVNVHNMDYGDGPMAKRSRMEGWTT